MRKEGDGGERMTYGYDEAKCLLCFYMKTVWENAELKWDSDNRAEVEDIIGSIKDGVEEQINEAMQDRIERYLEEKARQEGQGR